MMIPAWRSPAALAAQAGSPEQHGGSNTEIYHGGFA